MDQVEQEILLQLVHLKVIQEEQDFLDLHQLEQEQEEVVVELEQLEQMVGTTK